MVLPDTVTVRAPNLLYLWFTNGVTRLALGTWAPSGAVASSDVVRVCNIKLLV